MKKLLLIEDAHIDMRDLQDVCNPVIITPEMLLDAIYFKARGMTNALVRRGYIIVPGITSGRDGESVESNLVFKPSDLEEAIEEFEP